MTKMRGVETRRWMEPMSYRHKMLSFTISDVATSIGVVEEQEKQIYDCTSC
jgi:hypothetical protein